MTASCEHLKCYKNQITLISLGLNNSFTLLLDENDTYFAEESISMFKIILKHCTLITKHSLDLAPFGIKHFEYNVSLLHQLDQAWLDPK